MVEVTDSQRIMEIIDKLLANFLAGLRDLFTFFSDIGSQLIIVFFLITMMLLISGIILTVFYMCMRALDNGRKVHV